MTSRDFCFWLQGYFEINGNQPARGEPYSCWNLNDSQIDMIRNHLALVFKHEIDPAMGPPKVQTALDAIHSGGGSGSWPSGGVGGKVDGSILARC